MTNCCPRPKHTVTLGKGPQSPLLYQWHLWEQHKALKAQLQASLEGRAWCEPLGRAAVDPGLSAGQGGATIRTSLCIKGSGQGWTVKVCLRPADFHGVSRPPRPPANTLPEVAEDGLGMDRQPTSWPQLLGTKANRESDNAWKEPSTEDRFCGGRWPEFQGRPLTDSDRKQLSLQPRLRPHRTFSPCLCPPFLGGPPFIQDDHALNPQPVTPGSRWA